MDEKWLAGWNYRKLWDGALSYDERSRLRLEMRATGMPAMQRNALARAGFGAVDLIAATSDEQLIAETPLLGKRGLVLVRRAVPYVGITKYGHLRRPGTEDVETWQDEG